MARIANLHQEYFLIDEVINLVSSNFWESFLVFKLQFSYVDKVTMLSVLFFHSFYSSVSRFSALLLLLGVEVGQKWNIALKWVNQMLSLVKISTLHNLSNLRFRWEVYGGIGGSPLRIVFVKKRYILRYGLKWTQCLFWV